MALARSATSTDVSSCTSLVPCSTSAPLSIRTSVTMPATWLVTSTPCDAIMVPMEVRRSIHLSVRAASAVTVAGRRRHLRQERLDHLRFEHELEIAEPAQKQGNHDTGNDEASAHGVAANWGKLASTALEGKCATRKCSLWLSS